MRVPIHLAVLATVLALFAPARFLRFQDRVTKPLGIPAASDNTSVTVVSRAFWTAVVVVAAAAVVGAATGLALSRVLGAATPKGIAALQIIGASILLLATIYVRGPAIETYGRRTLIERVDRWVYCGGYFLGTAAIVASLAWS
jgi:anti-sigma-K factor RskA